MATRKYVDACLPRSGLCNKLFPWARALVLAKRANAVAIPSLFAQLKLGPFLRRERDSRTYFTHFRFPLVTRLTLLARACLLPQYSETEVEVWRSAASGILTVRGANAGRHFEELHGEEEFLLQKLREFTRRKWLERGDELPPPGIGIHIRLGDFRQTPQRHPICWYLESLSFARKEMGESRSIAVFSDGTDEELGEILRVPGVHRITTGAAISDLLVLSRSKLLIATGSSSFSAWAAYFGKMPVITRPGHQLGWWGLRTEREAIV